MDIAAQREALMRQIHASQKQQLLQQAQMKVTLSHC